jgi:hypothetical protein
MQSSSRDTAAATTTQKQNSRMYQSLKQPAISPLERKLPLVILGNTCLRVIPYVSGYYVPINILYVVVHDAVLLLLIMLLTASMEIGVMDSVQRQRSVVATMWHLAFPVQHATLVVDDTSMMTSCWMKMAMKKMDSRYAMPFHEMD